MPDITHQLDKPAMIDFLREFVRIPSVYLPTVTGANEAAAAQFVYELLDEWQLNPVMWEVAPGRPNIVAELHGGAYRCRNSWRLRCMALRPVWC
ncbi:MAG: hypothetical protein RI985_1692 [Chloroflexota bacterium]|jgi:succinyl-diaminopimelate desuccinylase